jgi:hypothetical protein
MSQLLFVAQSLNSDPDVYALSGSTYTDLTQDVTGGTADFLSAPQDRSGQLPVVFGYEADDYFQGFTNADGTHNLWVYDTTTQKLTDIDAANAWGSGLTPDDFIAYDGQVYFVGIDANGYDTLWTTNGTASGTFEVESNVADFGSMAAFNGLLYFNGNDGDGHDDLYAYSATTGDSVQIGPANLDPAYISPALTSTSPGAVSYDLFMSGRDSSGNVGLFVSNGSSVDELTSGNILPTDLVDMTYAVSSQNVTTDVSSVFFAGHDNGGIGLWIANTEGANEVVASSFGGHDTGLGLDPRDLTPLNGLLYFIGDDNYELNGSGLFVYNPATGSTAELLRSSDYNLEPDSATVESQQAIPATLAAYDGDLYFNGDPGDGLPDLYQYNPVTEQTTLIRVGNYDNGDGFEGGANPDDLISNGNPQTFDTGGGYVLYFSGAVGSAFSLSYTEGDWDAVYGYNGELYLNSAQTAVLGGGDWIDFASGSGNGASLYDTGGAWDSISGSNGAIYLTSAQTAVTGGDDSIEFAGGTGDALSLYSTGGAWDSVIGSNGEIYLTSAQAEVSGGGDYIDFAGGLGNAVSLYSTGGDWDSVIGYNGEIYLTSAQAAVTGGGDWIDFAGGSGNAVSLYDAGGDWDSVSGYYGDIYLASAQASVTGGGDWIDFAGGSGNATSLYNTSGVWDTVDGSEGEIYLTSAQAAVIGGGDWMDFAGGAGNAVNLSGTQGNWDAVSGSHGTVYLTGAQAEIVGSSNAVNLTGSSYVAVSGGSEAFVFTGAFGADVVSGFASSDAIQFSKSDFASWSALQPHISQSGANTLITLDPSDTVTLTNVTATSLISTQFTFA